MGSPAVCSIQYETIYKRFFQALGEFNDMMMETEVKANARYQEVSTLAQKEEPGSILNTLCTTFEDHMGST